MTHPIHLSTRADQIAHYKAVRQRIHQAAYKKPLLVIVPSVKSSQEWTRRPEWMRDNIQFDSHVHVYRRVNATASHIRWLRKRCVELDLDFGLIIGPNRLNRILPDRFRLYYEMKCEFPSLSYPQIGRAFGGRDHSTVLSGIARHKEKMRHENDS